MSSEPLVLAEPESDPRKSKVSSTVEQLQELIIGQFRPGDALPAEGKLAVELGVSRLTVREAMRTLSSLGLLEVRQGRRATVAPLGGDQLEGFFRLALQRDRNALLELIEVRRALEVHIARLAASRATRSDIQSLDLSLAAMRASSDRPDLCHSADVEFHQKLAAASGNRMLRFLIGALSESMHASFLKSLEGHLSRGGDIEDVIEQHRAIRDAVAERSPASAAKAMRDHLQTTEEDLLASLESADGHPR